MNDQAGVASDFKEVATVQIAGDYDDDGDVELDDYLVLHNSWGSDPNGDIDLDGDTDINDFTLFQQSFAIENPGASFSAMVAAAAAIPEPSSILLLAAGAAWWGMGRKRRAS